MEKEFWKAGNMLYPLPAVMVSSQRQGEKPNIITIAWTGTICTNPAMVYISVRPGRLSYDIIKETKEFVINLSTKKLVKAVDYCGVKSGRDVDKFKEMKLTPVSAEAVNAPLILESPVNIECRVKQIVELGSHDMFIAEVLGVHADPSYINQKGKFELSKSEPIVYSHGEYYGLGELMGSFGYSIKKK
jgi:flavin reductase (DIM6/NTAB) family NADH-FMN oxidoreductase RutF